MHLDLSDEQTALLIAELDRIIEGDRYPLSPRIQTLKEIRAMIKPYPVREPRAPPAKPLEPPSKGRYRKRRRSRILGRLRRSAALPQRI